MPNIQNTVTELLKTKGIDNIDDMDINQRLEYSGGDLHYDLSIEKVGENQLSVCQHYTQRMDLMRAPEIVFDYSNEDWTPIEYTNHETIPQTYERDETGVDGLTEFLQVWDKNLQAQFAQYLEGEQ